MIAQKSIFAAALSILAAQSTFTFAYWPNDPAINMVISEGAGEQSLPEVCPSIDGGCYISWYSTASGNYDVYLQRLDGGGTPQWQPNGILIDGHTQDTWITDYDMTVDAGNNAIIVVNDIRAGTDRDIYAYKISPYGALIWGPDGVTISDNNGFEPDPRVAVTSLGNVVIAWQEEDIIHLRKLSPAGIDLWNPPIITLTGQYGLSIPRIAPADNDGVILQNLSATGPNWWSDKHLYIHKFDAAGNALWGGLTGIPVQTAGGFGVQMRPEVASDGAGGAYCFWYDTRNNVHHVYAQRILANGTAAWEENGVIVSLTSGELQMYPQLVPLTATNDILIFYLVTDGNQGLDGIKGQRISATGSRLWGDGGAVVIPQANLSLSAIYALPQFDGAIVTYVESPDDVNNCLIKGVRIGGDGYPIWPLSPITMCSSPSSKGHSAACLNALSSVVEVWNDKRNDPAGDIYLQNINPDGSLGEAPIGISDNKSILPSSTLLSWSYPNPFNSSAIIGYLLRTPADVKIGIYDITGRRVSLTEISAQSAGRHSIFWDAANQPSGHYFCKIIAGDMVNTIEMTIVK